MFNTSKQTVYISTFIPIEYLFFYSLKNYVDSSFQRLFPVESVEKHAVSQWFQCFIRFSVENSVESVGNGDFTLLALACENLKTLRMFDFIT